MPNYGYLLDRDLRDLAAFLVSLGNPPQALKAGELAPAPPSGGLDDLALQGQSLYRAQGCVGCHSVDGSANVGPTWQALYGAARTFADGGTAAADDAYLRESILQPGARVVQGYPNVMPAYALGEEELAALVAYIQALGAE
jgi:cytochrome c oxidase subunit 2